MTTAFPNSALEQFFTPQDTSGVKEYLKASRPVDEGEGWCGTYAVLYNSGRIDMSVIIDGKPYESYDVKKDWGEIKQLIENVLEKGWVAE
jgi:hypothetical protein